jgi:DNA-binding CsgD family transcriptional regulator
MGIFRTSFIKGLGGARGWAVPMLYTKRLLYPGWKLFAPPDPLWGWAAWYLLDRIPADFEQVIERVPYYRPYRSTAAYEEYRHPEVDAVPERKRSPATPRYLPRWDGRDAAGWYKWKGDEYIGYDWRRAEKNPRIRQNYERAQRARAKRLARYRETYPNRLRASQAGGSIRFNGWLWRCPVCGKTCREIFYALPPTNVLRDNFALSHGATIRRMVEGLACLRCHRVRDLGVSSRNAWNDFIGYVTCGLLYGSEVKQPEGFAFARKREYEARINAKPARRRAEVIELLLQGLTYSRIAERLRLTLSTINSYVIGIYRRHGVHSRAELARAITAEGSTHPGRSTRSESCLIPTSAGSGDAEP